MASNYNNQSEAPLAQREEFRCILCSVHFPTRQAFSDHLVRRFVHLTPYIMTRVIHHPLPLPPPPPADESDYDSMASFASDSSQSSSTSIVNLPPPPVQSEDAEEENRRNQLTLNLMGEWEPLAQIREREEAIRAAGGDDINAPNDAPVDLELRLKTGPAALNLDLKLGL